MQHQCFEVGVLLLGFGGTGFFLPFFDLEFFPELTSINRVKTKPIPTTITMTIAQEADVLTDCV